MSNATPQVCVYVYVRVRVRVRVSVSVLLRGAAQHLHSVCAFTKAKYHCTEIWLEASPAKPHPKRENS
jgi:hypothetical protein